jgi:mannose-1-phosphate guanylyltransferase
MSDSRDLWSIVLAGGHGRRIMPLIESWLGIQKPKQYCTFVGSRSLLQHTISRAGRLCEKGRIVTVIDRTHQDYASAQLEQGISRVVVQPSNRETAPGIYLPLTYIRHWSSHSTVVIYPSDHFVYPEEPFLTAVQKGIEAAGRHPDRIVLLGVRPDEPDTEYGWVCPGEHLDHDNSGLRRVCFFIEKPDLKTAKAALSSGALWNTFIMAATVEHLWNLGWKFFPEMMPLFESLAEVIGTDKEAEILDSIYSSMPIRNFSSDLLQRAPEDVALVEMEGVLWSDWGRPEQIVSSLCRIDKRPAFSAQLVVAGRPKAAAAIAQAAPALLFFF